ncbi:ribonuclease Y [Coprothermobacter platensis]|uniref:ribonuclease Y n=1 Tax=Coprothermobacter platensis TaxID=108819 RepID=UPI000373075A|nr:ribonuclease Y [Coprothermobacter platensis]
MAMMIFGLLIGIVVGGVLAYFYAINSTKSKVQKMIEDAQSEASSIVKTAREEEKKAQERSESLVKQAQEQVSSMIAETSKELKSRREQLDKLEQRLSQREQQLDRRMDSIEAKEKRAEQKLQLAEEKLKSAESFEQEAVKKLQEIANMTTDEAKQFLFSRLEEELKEEFGEKIRTFEENFKEEADKKASELIVSAMQRLTTEKPEDPVISVVELPSEEIKGRIIGREGRNIRTFERITGVDLIIDDTPEVVVVSSFDPIRREIARRTLEKLIIDGRIQPARIEEIFAKEKDAIEQEIVEAGDKAVRDLGIREMNADLKHIVGQLKFRTSYGQNVLSHSVEVGFLAGMLASELHLDTQLAKRAGLLHDIGKALDHSIEGSHALIGADVARKYRENPVVVNAIASHHNEVPQESMYAVITQIADAISASRPGARRENYAAYIKRVQQLEEIAKEFDGVESAFAVQAGREIRVIVHPEVIGDNEAFALARDIAKKIEEELIYPGQIKVTVVRETRVAEYAK